MMKISNLLHVSIMVSDTQRSVFFYEKILGLSLIKTRPDLGYPGAWFDLGAQQLHLLELPNMDSIVGRPDHPGRDRHIAFDCEDISPLITILESNDIEFTKSRSGRNAVFIRDPDGNGLEFVGS